MVNNAFGEKLRELRKKNGLTQIQLSKRIHIDVKAIKNWEAGFSNPSIESVIAVAQFFNVSSDQLLGIAPKGDKVVVIPNSVPERDQEIMLLMTNSILQIYMKNISNRD